MNEQDAIGSGEDRTNGTARTLREALERFRVGSPTMGSQAEDDKEQRQLKELKVFRADLQNVSKTNTIYFVICVLCQGIIFGGACFLVIRSLGKTAELATVIGIAGAFLVGLVQRMSSLWKAKVGADMLIVLAGRLKPNDLKGLVEILARNYFK